MSLYVWAMPLARIYEAQPLSCPICHGHMRLVAFINAAGSVKWILDYNGESTRPPRIAIARGPMALSAGRDLVEPFLHRVGGPRRGQSIGCVRDLLAQLDGVGLRS